jgi:oligopeptide transport system permease protein
MSEEVKAPVIDDALFAPASKEEREGVQTMREPTTYWQDVRKKFRANKVAFISLIFIGVIIVLSFVGPLFSQYSYSQQVKGSEYIAPFTRMDHILGTDSLGRDEFVRLMYGTRISILIGVVASIMVVIIGVIYGAVSGYFGGVVDNIMMRIVDIIYSVPSLLVIILLSVILAAPLKQFCDTHASLTLVRTMGAGLISLFITFALLYWTDMARMVRGQILSIKEAEYVSAAKALGAGGWRVIRKHLIPNSMGVIIVTGTLNIPTAIFTEAFLSYLGIGVSAPLCSLGSLASDALNGIYTYPRFLVMPSVLISLVILAFNMVGDGLRDALDPRVKGKK